MKYQPTSKAKPPTHEELRLCRDRFEQMPQIRALTAKAQRLIHDGAFEEAKQVLATKARVFDKTVAYLTAQAEQQLTEVKSDAAGLPSDDLQKINCLFVTLYMAIDIMDSCLMDINDTIHKTDKSLTFEKVDGLHELAQACKQHIEQFRAEQDLYREAYWGDITDNAYQMLYNKAKAIIRKKEGQHGVH
jgi:hypothetical protein